MCHVLGCDWLVNGGMMCSCVTESWLGSFLTHGSVAHDSLLYQGSGSRRAWNGL